MGINGNQVVQPADNTEETFEKYHQELRQELNNANWHFTVWKYLQELRGTYLEELNQAPSFFGLTMYAHLLAALVRINKFFDKKEQHLSIRKFLDFVEQNLEMFSNEFFEARMRKKGKYETYIVRDHREITHQKVRQDRRRISDLPVASIRRWRNAVLVHLEAECVVRSVDVMRTYPVKERQIDEIISTLDDMLNEYLVGFDASTWAKDMPIKYEIKAVVDAIRFKLTEVGRQQYMSH
jgi:hypothetical protein